MYLDMHTDNNNIPITKKLSHKKWRTLQKRLKRKLVRQKEAQSRDKTAELNDDCSENSANETAALEEEERQRCEQHKSWLERERVMQAEWQAKKLKEERDRQRQQEEQARIQEEWAKQQEKEKEEKEAEEEKKKQQAELLRKANMHEKKDTGSDWHRPFAPPSSAVSGDILQNSAAICPFFTKVAACRFAERCSRVHVRPESSRVLLISGMFLYFGLEQSTRDDYDTDITLEYEDREMYEKFCEFYEDVLPEFKSLGRVEQFKVCCNHEPHLRGNVYVQYEREEDAYNAMVTFNARWYAGKQLSVEFANISKWKNALCGLYDQRRCPKGKTCNFLHVFKNPRNEFSLADRDIYPGKRRTSENGERLERSRSSHQLDDRRYSRRSHRSKSPHRAHSKRRSRSPNRSRRSSSPHRRHRTRSTSPKKKHKKSPRNYSSKSRHRRSSSESSTEHKHHKSKRKHKHKSSRRAKHDLSSDELAERCTKSPSVTESTTTENITKPTGGADGPLPTCSENAITNGEEHSKIVSDSQEAVRVNKTSNCFDTKDEVSCRNSVPQELTTQEKGDKGST